MKSVEGYYDSMYGRIRSAWKSDGKTVTYWVTVPANTAAALYLPVPASGVVEESGKPASQAKGVSFLRHENDKTVFQLGSGSYVFRAR